MVSDWAKLVVESIGNNDGLDQVPLFQVKFLSIRSHGGFTLAKSDASCYEFSTVTSFAHVDETRNADWLIFVI